MVGNQTYRDKAIRQKGNSPEQALRSLRNYWVNTRQSFPVFLHKVGLEAATF